MTETLSSLLATLKANGGKTADLDLVERAYRFAAEAHHGQKRLTGEDYVIHPLAAASKLAKMRMDTTVIAATLLHDVLEDTALPVEELHKKMRSEFGEDTTALVERVTKLGKVQYRGLERYVENLRKMFVAMAEDVRAIFIKFADRIHNLETLEVVPEPKRQRIAREALELYAPIANRLGMGEIRGELEDLSFRYVLPEEYRWVTAQVRDRLEQKKKYVDHLKKIIERDLEKAQVSVSQIGGRTKHLYSLYKKLIKHDRDINRIYDLVALRIQVPTVADCYAAMGIVHSRWKPLKGRIKDYISQPKPNGYQSLHTTVFADDGEIVEFQIRTPEMHRAAEFGVAAHWQYTESGKRSRALKPKELGWIKDMAKIQKEIEDHGQFMKNLETLKIDVFQNRIFIFTPKGDVIDLPESATPVDFAYAIHTDVGNRCSAARVNNEIASLNTALKSGDMVEIVIDKNRKTPSSDWLKFVKTKHAKEKIREAARISTHSWIKKVHAVKKK